MNRQIRAVSLLAGLMFLALAWGNRNYERHRRSRGVVLEGLVVDSEWDMNSTGAVFQAPVVFQLALGWSIGMSSSCPPMASISSRTIASTFCSTFSPSGSQL